MITIPEITSQAEEGFHDFVFAIRSSEKLSDGSRRIRAAGTAHGHPVEFDAILGSGWTKGTLGPGMDTYKGNVEIRSVGMPSDELVKAMDSIYQTNLHPNSMKLAARFTAISLEGNPALPEKGPVKLKLFFESDKEELYAELYLNIDWASSRVHLDEKDPDYRTAVIHALAGNAG
jgi:hypothetical protein